MSAGERWITHSVPLKIHSFNTLAISFRLQHGPTARVERTDQMKRQQGDA